jgi:hypothetical protein
MVLQFKVVADQSLWVLDSDKMRYARVSKPMSEIAENPSSDSAVEEFGTLKWMSPLMELYRLEGRTPTTDGPGAGLTSIAIVVRVVDETLEIAVNANVDITEPVCVKPISRVRCEVLGQNKKPVH